MRKDLRVLFTTKYHEGEPEDFYGYHTRSRMTVPRLQQPGLRFLKQNIPPIEILEFPTWDEFTRVMSKGWDVIGFSFYTRETNEVMRMTDYARKQGVQEIWGGNYGPLEPSASAIFDRVFLGYAEPDVAEALGYELNSIIHPPIIGGMGVQPLGYPLVKTGWLFTTRGCPMKCTFCEAPVFAPTVDMVSLESIDRVLRYYKDEGVQFIIIYDETFGIAPKQAKEVIRLLASYNLPWGCLSRADILKHNLDEWLAAGLVGVFMGIENINPEVLADVQKREKLESLLEVLEMLDRRNCFVVGGYIIGFENDTIESVKRDLQEVYKLRPDLLGISILTPYPQTPVWDQIQQRYGIDTSDWSKFDQTNLVWNHPRLSREDAKMLVEYGNDLFLSPEHTSKVIHKMVGRFMERRNSLDLRSMLFSTLRTRLHGLEGEPSYFPQSLAPKKEEALPLVAIQPRPTATQSSVGV